MTNERWDRLDALAAAATPETKGRWRFRWCDFRDGTPRHEYAYVEWGGTDEGFGTAALSPAMAHYLAACDPATIRDLVAAVRERDELAGLRERIEDVVLLYGLDDTPLRDETGRFIDDVLRAALHREDGA